MGVRFCKICPSRRETGASSATHLVGFVHGELTTAEYKPSLLPRFAPLSLLHQVATLEGDVFTQPSAVATGPDRFEERPGPEPAASLGGVLRRLPAGAGGGCEAGRVGFCVAAGTEGVFGLGDGREGQVGARPVEWWRRRVRFVVGAGTVSCTRDGRRMRWLRVADRVNSARDLIRLVPQVSRVGSSGLTLRVALLALRSSKELGSSAL